MARAGLSVRAKLTLSTVAVLAFVYVLLGITVQFAASKAIKGSIDEELLRDARRFRGMWNRPPPPPGIGGGFGVPPGGPPGRDAPPPGFGGGAGGPMPGPPPDGPPTVPTPGRVGEGRPGPRDRPIQVRKAPPEGVFPPVTVWRRKGIEVPFFEAKEAYDINAVPDAIRGLQGFSSVTWKGQPMRVLTFGFPSHDDPSRYDAVIQIPYPMGDVEKTLSSLARTLFLLLPVGIGSVALASLFIVGWAISPVREITRTTGHIEAESLGGRLEVRGRDEFAELAETINGMLGRLDGAFSAQRVALRQLQAIVEQQRRFTADASHEFKTPLSVVKAHAGLLRKERFASADATESIEAIDAAADRMATLVRDLLLLARTDAGQLSDSFQSCDLNQVAEHAMLGVPGKCNIQFKPAGEPLTVCGSSSALDRVFTNLLDNACRHSDRGSEIRFELRSDGPDVVAEVIDPGEGIAAEHLPRIFDRFYRVDSSRYSETGGTGLGLAICKGVVEAHHGTISVESEPGKGTRFTIRLPSFSGNPLP